MIVPICQKDVSKGGSSLQRRHVKIIKIIEGKKEIGGKIEIPLIFLPY